MSDAAALRARALGGARRVVIKVGSQLLADSPAGRPATIADELSSLRERGLEVVIVSSGAIALGSRVMGLQKRPRDLPTLQAAAAVGQNRLMAHWQHAFSAHGMHIGQVLLTHDDLSNRARFLNARHALRALLDAGVVPIVNENDTVAVEEIKYGDNDQLSALVCNLVGADALVILTDVDGLCDAPPDQGGVRVPLVRDVDVEAVPVAGGVASGRAGSGGMASKVKAAKSAGRHGVATLVANGSAPRVLRRALSGEDVGTLFVPSPQKMSSRKHWLAYGPRPAGTIVVDAGAHQAVAKEGCSLLPAGIVAVEGNFQLGDIVSLVDGDKNEFGRGLAGYSAEELRRLAGRHSADIESVLGYKYLDEVIHRDDLVLL